VTRHLPRGAGFCFRRETNDVPSPEEVGFAGSEERGVAVVFKAFLLLVL